jgi:predicted metal-binding membrane protein
MLTEAALEPALKRVVKRDQAIIGLCLGLLTVFAWAYLLWLTYNTSAAMPGVKMEAMVHPWSAAELTLSFGMWAVMSIGMMTPSAAPMILLYARAGRELRDEDPPFAVTGWFAGGYFLAWIGFAVLAAVAQGTLTMNAELQIANRLFAGWLFVVAGLYQLTELKKNCLRRCQSPLIVMHRDGGFEPSGRNAFQLGFRHGLYCIGCCWPVMAFLFLVGIMNLLWVAALSAFIFAEKVLPDGRILVRVAGLVLIFDVAIFLLGTGT